MEYLAAQVIFEPNLFPYKYSNFFSNLVILHTYLLMKMGQGVPKRRHNRLRLQAIFEPNLFPINTPTFLKSSHTSYLPAYEDGTECSETSAYKIQTPGNYPEENIQHLGHVLKAPFFSLKITIFIV